MKTLSGTTISVAERSSTVRHSFRSRFWTLTLVLSAGYVAAVASQYLWLPPIEYAFGAQSGTYASNAMTMMLHIAAGIVALLAGTAQFVPQLKPYRRWHRGTGIVYCIAVLVAGAAGLKAAGFAYGGASNTVAFGLMSSLWLTTTALAVINLLKGNFDAHQRWMKRSFAITLAAVTLRIELGLLIFVGGFSFAETYLIVPWTSWVLNLLIVEWTPTILKFRKPVRRVRSTHSDGHPTPVMTPSSP